MPSGPSQKMKFKLKIIVGGFVFLSFCVLIIRIIYISCFARINGMKYGDKAYKQQLSSEKIKANRGTIYDRNMVPLAQSATTWQISVAPNEIKSDEDREKIAEKLHELFPEIEKEKILKKCAKKNKYEIIRNQCEQPARDAILKFVNDEKIDGIHMAIDTKRYYPEQDLASHVLGFCGADNQGLAGLELFYDNELKGTDGKLVSIQNGKGQPMPYNYESYSPAKNGNSIVTTIDSKVQRIVQKALETHCNFRKPLNRACAIVMDARNQEILALSVYPSYNPNKPFELPDVEKFPKTAGMPKQEAQNANWRIKPVSDVYEPGSVFKIVTGAAVLEEKLMDLNQTFTCTGAVKVGPEIMHCWKRAGGHGYEDFTQAFINSCNPCFIKMGETLGPSKFFQYFNLFGMTSKTNIDLRGEAVPIYVKEEDLGPVQLASESFGQTAAVTPLHIMRAFSAIVNDGYINGNPHLLNRIINEKGETTRSYSSPLKTQVISKETAEKMKKILTAVVDGLDENNHTNAYIPGHTIIGKSGTAQKLNEKKADNENNVERYVPSYIGAFNVYGDRPIIVMVQIDSPTFPPFIYYGGEVTAPLFKEIVIKLLNYYNIPADRIDEFRKKTFRLIPTCEGLNAREARDKLFANDFNNFVIIGNGDKILQQIPPCGSNVNKNTKIRLYSEEISEDDKVKVPNVISLTQAQANQLLANHQLNIQILNNSNKIGYAISQDPEPGTTVLKGHVVDVNFAANDGTD